jgi:hypothetical protein
MIFMEYAFNVVAACALQGGDEQVFNSQAGHKTVRSVPGQSEPVERPDVRP